ncbi:MAG: ABC transporter ATP-binding protein [Myxococcota bacterium]
MADPTVGTRRIRDYFMRYLPSFLGGIFALIITQGFGLAVPRFLKLATDALVAKDLASAQQYALGLLLVAVLGAIARIASRLLIFNAGRDVEYDIRSELYQELSKRQPSFFQELSSGQVMSRAINDLTQVRLLLGPALLNVTNTTIVYVVVVPLLFASDATLAFWCLLALPMLAFGGRLIGRRMYEDSKEAQERLGILSSRVQENLGGVNTIRAFRREGAEEQSFAHLNDRYVDVNMRLARLRGLMFPFMGLCGAFGTIMLLWLGGERVIDGRMSMGQFVEFNAYLAALTWPTIALGWMLSLFQRGIASMDRVNDVFKKLPTIVDGPTAPAPFRGRVEIKDLSFTYSGAKAPALDHISTVFEPGETVVIVGRTGSGKSTIMRALTRLIEIPRGAVFLDGIDVVDLPLAAVRGAIAYAPQEAFLFSRTIFENIAFGAPESPDAAVEEATRRAGLTPDISGFPDGLDTLVGERGITLSGGQRQRAALARALLVEKPLLLLDDTLSAVDTETENKILTELARRSSKQTTILITHRLAGAALADRILVMDHGKIVEQGTEDELLAKNGIYAEMHRQQRLREALEKRESLPSAAAKAEVLT